MFDSLAKDIKNFQEATDLECISNCGLCCNKPDIYSTPLEFLPLAYHLHKEGKAMEWYVKLKENKSSLCPMFKPLLLHNEKGYCSAYKYRGLICRLFGFSATKDKYGNTYFSTCKSIKNDQQEKYQKALNYIKSGGKVAIMHDYYFRLSSIDADMNMRFYPVNEAILKSIEIVLGYYSYRKKAV